MREDDNSREDNISGDDSDDDGVPDKEDSDHDDDVSMINEDEIFDHASDEDVDRYERMYIGGRTWESEPNGKFKLRQWDMFIDKKKKF